MTGIKLSDDNIKGSVVFWQVSSKLLLRARKVPIGCRATVEDRCQRKALQHNLQVEK
jgi:hypothetical protein